MRNAGVARALSGLILDVRHSVRRIRRDAGANAAVVLTVALGICAAATVFTLIDTLLLKPLAGVRPRTGLVNVHVMAADGSTFHSISMPNYRDISDGQGAFSGLAAFSSSLVSLSGDGEPQLAIAQVVTGNYFGVLGTRPALGRLIGEEHDTGPGRDAVVVLSSGLWKTRFGEDPAIVGRSISINGHPCTVIGVAEAGFRGTFLGFPFDLWIPTSEEGFISSPDRDRLNVRSVTWLEMVGRLKKGVSLGAARSAMDVVAKRLEHDHPETNRGAGFDLRETQGFEDSMRAGAIGFFAFLATLAGLVLAIACTNVAGILLARAMAREKEMSVRLALGAGRARLARLLVIDSLLLFLAGGVVGSFLTLWTAPALSRFRLPLPIPLLFDFTPGLRVFAFAALASGVAGLLVGLAVGGPATRPILGPLLRAGASTERRGAARLRSAFVALQVALSALLLVAAGLLGRTIRHAAAADPGFVAQGLSMTSLDLSLLGYDARRAQDVFDRAVEKASALPGVESVAVAGILPLGLGNRSTTINLPGRGIAAENGLSVDVSDVGESYFQTLRIPILRGRAFERQDGPDAPGVAILNETLATKLWPGEDALGRSIIKEGRALTVVGVARDGKYRRLWEEPRGFLYVSTRQSGGARRLLVLRGGGALAALAVALRREIRSLEPQLPFATLLPVADHIGFALLPQRVAGAVAGLLGIIGVALAGIGLAGLVAYSVACRTREIGIRLALGARPGDVVRNEIRRGAKVAATGLALGTLSALLLTRLIASFLYGVKPTDPATFLGVTSLLLALTLVACWVPARRAAGVDPVIALRSE